VTSPGIGGGGIVGVALEATSGTFEAATVFAPINNESITMQEETQFRRPIRQTVDIVNAVAGNEHPAGDIEMDAREDLVAYFLHAARLDVVKSGAVNFTYTFTGNADAVPAETLSITIVRNGEVFAYTGCVVAGYKFSIAEGILIFTVSIIGRSEATQSAPTPSWPTTTPYGMGTYAIQVPTATPVTDTDSFEFTVDDGGEPQFRLKNTGRGADFIKLGERATTLMMARDFLTRTDYDAFKAVTAQSITLIASKGANNSITMLIPAAIKESYEVGLSGQGDLLRAQINYQAVLDSGSPQKAFEIAVKTQADITP
jgi:hypothetical protein